MVPPVLLPTRVSVPVRPSLHLARVLVRRARRPVACTGGGTVTVAVCVVCVLVVLVFVWGRSSNAWIVCMPSNGERELMRSSYLDSVNVFVRPLVLTPTSATRAYVRYRDVSATRASCGNRSEAHGRCRTAADAIGKREQAVRTVQLRPTGAGHSAAGPGRGQHNLAPLPHSALQQHTAGDSEIFTSSTRRGLRLARSSPVAEPIDQYRSACTMAFSAIVSPSQSHRSWVLDGRHTICDDDERHAGRGGCAHQCAALAWGLLT